MINKSLCLILISLWLPKAAMAWSSEAQSMSTVRRGGFSLGVGLAYEQARLMNLEGNMSSLSGQAYLTQIDVRLGGEGGPGEFRIFGLARTHELKGDSDASSSLKSDYFAGGFKIFANNYLFLGLGYGTAQQTLSHTNGTLKLTNNCYMGQMGLEFPITATLYGGISATWLVNPVKKTEAMENHSFSESFSATVMLMYSPPASTVTVLKGK